MRRNSMPWCLYRPTPWFNADLKPGPSIEKEKKLQRNKNPSHDYAKFGSMTRICRKSLSLATELYISLEKNKCDAAPMYCNYIRKSTTHTMVNNSLMLVRHLLDLHLRHVSKYIWILLRYVKLWITILTFAYNVPRFSIWHEENCRSALNFCIFKFWNLEI